MGRQIGIGVDIIQIDRVRKTIGKSGSDYLNAVYTPEEIREASGHRDPTAYFATRFAAKEAVAKCLELPEDEGLEWSQISILRAPGGGLRAKLLGYAAELKPLTESTVITVSVSWDTDYAVAFASAYDLEGD